uniref:Phospholipase B-like n=1 Tax=Rhabditophanes sp. KR3021 TaxID=114890 RepID=A0AC35U4X8_9BILA
MKQAVLVAFLATFFVVALTKSTTTNGEQEGPTKPDTFVSVCLNATGSIYRTTKKTCERQVALGSYKNAVNSTGWGFLEIETFPGYSYELQAYAAGYAEGLLTKLQIYYHHRNTIEGMCKDHRQYCRRLYDYLTENLDWIRDEVQAKAATDKYWKHVNVTFTQLTGVFDGYMGKDMELNVRFDMTPIYMIQLSGELFDLTKFLHKKPDPVHDDPGFQSVYHFHEVDETCIDRSIQLLCNLPYPGKCSGLVKLTEGNKDLLFSHVSMSSYSTMNRLVKLYKFAYDKSEVPGHTVSFSGYAGALSSADDYTLTSAGLLSSETTIANFNETLYTDTYIKPRGQIHCWVRSFIANALADSAQEWTDIFAEYNSGTYNNQWTVLSYKGFTPNQELPSTGVLWILEQVPGFTMARDMTWFLKKYGYWPSYNIPYFHEISMLTNFDNQGKINNWWKWGSAPRARIFHRDQGKVTDMNSLRKLMRYNDYTHEKFSRCNCTPPYTAEASISARGDLNLKNGTYEVDGMKFRDHGSLDMKATNFELFKQMRMEVIGGPTYGDVPPFDWRTTLVEAKHFGQPDLWKFDPVITEWVSDVKANV